jgi:hypothetical protein
LIGCFANKCSLCSVNQRSNVITGNVAVLYNYVGCRL